MYEEFIQSIMNEAMAPLAEKDSEKPIDIETPPSPNEELRAGEGEIFSDMNHKKRIGSMMGPRDGSGPHMPRMDSEEEFYTVMLNLLLRLANRIKDLEDK